MGSVRLVFAVVLSLGGPSLAGAQPRLLPAAPTPQAGPAGFRGKFQALREDLRRFAYESAQVAKEQPTLAPYFRELGASLLRCFDEEHARPNQERFHRCLVEADEERFTKLFALGYPGVRQPLCEIHEVPKTQPTAPGENSREMVADAENRIREGDIDAARALLEKAINLVEADRRVAIGTAYCRQDDRSWARLVQQIPEAASALAVDYSYCRALLRRAELRARETQWSDVIADAERVLRFFPESIDALELRATALIEESRFVDAERSLKRALQLALDLNTPKSRRAPLYALLASVARKGDDLKKAYELAGQALALDPQNSRYRDELRYVKTLLDAKNNKSR